MRIGIVGAAGLVGQTVLSILEQRNFPITALKLGATARSAGTTVTFAGGSIRIEEVGPEFFEGLDVAFIAAGTAASRELAPLAARAGCIAIDKSNAFRLDPAVPLVVPEVNPEAIESHHGIIASPNCSTIQLVLAIAPIDRQYGLRRVIVSTYQAVSGTGRDAIEELYASSRSILAGQSPQAAVYPEPIAFNLIPAIEGFDDDGYCLEELKLKRESERILGHSLNLTATTVRVPVETAHSESVNIELEREASLDDLRKLLRGAPGVALHDDPQAGVYPTPRLAAGRDEVFVGRLRVDPTLARAFHLFVVADNLRKGAALNAVQIAELLLG